MIDYLKDPEAIYARSFAIIRREADLAAVPASCRAVAERLIHACGMTDIVADLRIDERLPEAVRGALTRRRPVLCDCEMVRAAVVRRFLPDGVEVLCTLGDERTADLARVHATTRSAAAVALWPPRLDGAVVVIGNAPTALFALLEGLDAGWPRPAAVIAMPVGFVGAAESKQALNDDPRGIPHATVLGRRGGSAMAAGAFNAVAGARP